MKTILSDPYLNVYCNIMDSLHHYLFHLYDTGFRFLNNNNGEEEEKEKEKELQDPYKCYDETFATMNKKISSTRDASRRFSRISSGGKYHIEAGINPNKNTNENTNINTKKQKQKGKTYLDTIYDHLKKLKINKKSILRLKRYLNEEEYDTEAMDLDLKISDKDTESVGNISQHMNKNKK